MKRYYFFRFAQCLDAKQYTLKTKREKKTEKPTTTTTEKKLSNSEKSGQIVNQLKLCNYAIVC